MACKINQLYQILFHFIHAIMLSRFCKQNFETLTFLFATDSTMFGKFKTKIKMYSLIVRDCLP